MTHLLARMQKLKKSRLLNDVSSLASGTVISQAVIIGCSPILTRLYGPAEFGLLGLFSAFAAILGVAATLRYDTAIVSTQDEEEAAHLVALCLAINLLIALLGALLLRLLIRGNLLGYERLPEVSVWFITPSAFAAGMFSTLRYWLVRQSAFPILSRTIIGQSISRVATQVVIGLLQPSAIGLIIGETVGRLLGLGNSLRYSLKSLGRFLPGITVQSIRNTAFKFRQFPVYAAPSSIMDAAGALVPLPIIAQLYGPQQAGYFALVQRIISVPMGLVVSSVADAFHNRIRGKLSEDPSQITHFVLQAAGSLLLLGLLTAGCLVLGGLFLFPVIFGRAWAEAGCYASLMAPWACAQMVVSPLSRLVFVMNGQRSKLMYDIVALAASVLSLNLAYQFGVNALWAVAILSFARTLGYIFYFVILLSICRRHQQDAS